MTTTELILELRDRVDDLDRREHLSLRSDLTGLAFGLLVNSVKRVTERLEALESALEAAETLL